MQRLLQQIGQHERLFLLLDYDGTLVPMAPTPGLARTTPEVLDTLRALCSAEAIQLAIISGRSLSDLQRLLPLEGLFLAGNHGVEVLTPEGERLWLINPDGVQPTLRRLAAQLKASLTDLSGCVVENKGVSLALHYRLASEATARAAIDRFTRLGERYVKQGTYEWLRGKKIVELRAAGMNKGRAVKFLLDRYSKPGALPIYLGDDRTDEDAFQALKDSGITILVSAARQPSAAKYRLASPTEVQHFLKALGRKYG